MWYPAKTIKETKVVTQNSTTTVVVQSSTNTAVVIGASLGTALLLVSIGISLLLGIRNKNLNKFLTDEEIQEFLNGKKRLDQHAKKDENADVAVEYMKFNNEYALAKMDFSIGSETIYKKLRDIL